MPEKCNCPICGIAATMTAVWNKLDSRIECPRCKVFDIDHRAEVNLANSNRAPNWAILSGRTREHWEWQRGDDLPRLVWKEVEGDRDGKYIIEGQNVERLSSQLKAEKLFQHLSRKTDRTAGEPLLLRNPIDLSLAYARSIDEFVAILSFLQDRALVQFDRLDEDTFQLSMTIQGADRDSSVEKEDDSNEILPRADVEIVGPSIDSGAFGTIYPGLQLSLNRPVAVKIIKANAKPDAIDHARGLARVKHANVVAVYDVGSVIDPVTGELVDCVVMELLEGKKLFEIWKELDEAKACKLCEQILDGVSAIHAAGICHHDLHAGNIMVCEEDVKIIDIQYTESARLSNLRTQSRAELQRDDCKAVAGILRSVYWHANKDRLPPLEELFSNISDIKSIEILLNHLTSDTSLSNQIDSVEPSIDGLNEDDLTVLKLAGQQVTECDRFPGRISVPQIGSSAEFVGEKL